MNPPRRFRFDKSSTPPFVPTIQSLTIGSDGSIGPSSALADGVEPIGVIHLVEGISDEVTLKLNELVPFLPENLLALHRCDNLAAISDDWQDERLVLAKWSREAIQQAEVWARENRLRRFKSPFDINDCDPETSQLDHERYDRTSDPYRLYDPLVEFVLEKEEPVPPQDPPTAKVVKAHVSRAETRTQEPAKSDRPSSLDTAPTSLLLQPAIRTAGEEQSIRPAMRRAETDLERARKWVDKYRAAAPEPAVTRHSMIAHLARECISIYNTSQGDIIQFVILFDPPRQHAISRVRYNILSGGRPETVKKHDSSFEDSPSNLDKFLRKLQFPEEPDLGIIITSITDALLKVVLDDQGTLFSRISQALDEIELSMERGSRPPESWREYPPRWRNHLFHQIETIRYFQTLVSSEAGMSSDAASVGSLSSRSTLRGKSLKSLQVAERRLEAMLARVEGTYQVLMSTMSILESERAIAQAEVVMRLTDLAFFFIPLAFVASVFGMNINEFENNLTVWLWVAVSVGLTISTYAIRFRHPISRAVQASPRAIRSLRWDLLVSRFRRRTQIVRSVSPLVRLIVFYGLYFGLLWVARIRLTLGDNSIIGMMASLPASIAFFSPIDGIRREFRKIYAIVMIPTAMFFAGVGVALWRLCISSLPNSTKLGLAFGVVSIPAFQTTVWSILPTFLPPRPLRPAKRDDGYDTVPPPPGQLGEPTSIAMGPRRDLPWFTWWMCFKALWASIVYVGVGIGLWRFLDSPTISREVKLGVSLGVIAPASSVVGRNLYLWISVIAGVVVWVISVADLELWTQAYYNMLCVSIPIALLDAIEAI